MKITVRSHTTIVAALEVRNLLIQSIDRFAYGRNTGSWHIESAGELSFHIRTSVLAMAEKRTATKPVANTDDSTPPKREEQMSGMIAVFCMISILLRNVFCSYMNLLATFMSGANLWAQKKPNFVDWTISVVRSGLNQ